MKTPTQSSPPAILLLAYGAPESPDQIAAFLASIRAGGPVPPALLATFTERYRQIGGRSPLTAITQSLATRLAQRLGRPVYVGMRHWCPTIKETVAKMAAAGIRQALVICLAPHYSELSVGTYRRDLHQALPLVENPPAVEFIPNWHTAPNYLAGMAANIRAGLNAFAPQHRDQITVLFSAHSLPAAIVQQNDPYPNQLAETAQLVAERLGLPREQWQLAYQSAPQSASNWLEPCLEALLPQLAASGKRHVLVAPIGFVIDNLEVLYDLDIELKQLAQIHQVQLVRAPLLNDSSALVETLADLASRGEHAC